MGQGPVYAAKVLEGHNPVRDKLRQRRGERGLYLPPGMPSRRGGVDFSVYFLEMPLYHYVSQKRSFGNHN